MDDQNLLYIYLKDLNDELKDFKAGDTNKTFAKLIALEKQFREKLNKTSKGKKVYSTFINMIYKSSGRGGGIVMVRPYFRQRELTFINTIHKAVEKNKPDELYGAPINFKFISFAMKELTPPPKELVKIFEEIKIVRNDIVNSYLFLAFGRAKVHNKSAYSSSIDMSDLVQIANEALIIAVDKYVPTETTVFAHMAMGRIIANLIATGSSPSAASINSGGQKRLYRIRRLLERSPHLTREQVAEILDVTEMEVNDLIESTRYSSIDQPIGSDEGRTLGDVIHDDDPESAPDNIVENEDLALKLLAAYKTLTIIEQKILRLKGVNPMRTLNKMVAVSKPNWQHDTMTAPAGSRGFVVSDKLGNTIVESNVIFDSERFKTGDVVYFKSDIRNHGFMNNLYNFDGRDFILVPEDMVVAVK